MKKFFFSILFTIICLNAFSQENYPKIQTDSFGKTLVIMTLEQAQALDNATDLLSLLEKANSKIADLDTLFIRVVADRDKIITEQELLIIDLKKQGELKEGRISTLLSEISTYQNKIENLEKDVKNLEKQNQTRDREIKRLKIKVMINKSFGAVAILTAGLIFLL